MRRFLEDVRRIAEDVRGRCVAFAMSESSYGYDYHGCNDLDTMCAVASTVLARVLRDKGVDPGAMVVEGDFRDDSHCWVLSRGMIVDITASQFGMGDIEIHPEGTEGWTPGKTGSPGVVASDWGKEQAPTGDVVSKILAIRPENSRPAAMVGR